MPRRLSILAVPSGMKGLGSWVRAQETAPGSGEYMRYGLYSCRGTCQCSTGTYSAPGSHGYEAQDTEWMIAAGAQYLSEAGGGLPPMLSSSPVPHSLLPAWCRD